MTATQTEQPRSGRAERAGTAVTVERNGKVIGAAFPNFAIRIVRVPWFDPDRDGLVNGHTHELQVDASGVPIESIGKGQTGRFSGLQGSPAFLGHQLRCCVDDYNHKAPIRAAIAKAVGKAVPRA
jgi:hypothetical protein